MRKQDTRSSPACPGSEVIVQGKEGESLLINNNNNPFIQQLVGKLQPVPGTVPGTAEWPQATCGTSPRNSHKSGTDVSAERPDQRTMGGKDGEQVGPPSEHRRESQCLVLLLGTEGMAGVRSHLWGVTPKSDP